MKIIIANRNFFLTGGPEKYMFTLMKNMAGHQFIPFCVAFEQNRGTEYSKYFLSPPSNSEGIHFNEFKMSVFQRFAYGASLIYSMEARRKLERLITDERPDLALFLNTVYFSDSIIDACRAHNVPIICRLSDFNKICANYLLYRDGKVCEECVEYGLSRAIFNKCGGYQRSAMAAIVRTASMWLSRARRLNDYVSFFIAPSAFTRDMMIRGGFNPQKIVHIPTMVEAPESAPGPPQDSREVLYVGRISYGKGLETLLKAFELLGHENASLSIVGDDRFLLARRLKARVPGRLKGRVIFHGFQEAEQVKRFIRSAYCLVTPSVWYENQPNTVLEGMSFAKPVIVSDLGSMKELIEHGKTGYRFEPGNARDLAAKLDALLGDPRRALEMGLRAREYVLGNHSLEAHLSSLEGLFQKALGLRNSDA